MCKKDKGDCPAELIDHNSSHISYKTSSNKREGDICIVYWLNGPVPTVRGIVQQVRGIILIHQVVSHYILADVVVCDSICWRFQVVLCHMIVVIVFPQVQAQYCVDVQHVNLNPRSVIIRIGYPAMHLTNPHIIRMPWSTPVGAGCIWGIWEVICLANVVNTKSGEYKNTGFAKQKTRITLMVKWILHIRKQDTMLERISRMTLC